MERNTAPSPPPQTLVIAFPQIAVSKFKLWEGKKEKKEKTQPTLVIAFPQIAVAKKLKSMTI
jgi:hypothetical protein